MTFLRRYRAYRSFRDALARADRFADPTRRIPRRLGAGT